MPRRASSKSRMYSQTVSTVPLYEVLEDRALLRLWLRTTAPICYQDIERRIKLKLGIMKLKNERYDKWVQHGSSGAEVELYKTMLENEHKRDMKELENIMQEKKDVVYMLIRRFHQFKGIMCAS
jgi:hypothetical protein